MANEAIRHAGEAAKAASLDWVDWGRDENVDQKPLRIPRLPDSPWADRIGWFGVAFVALALAPTWPLASLGVVLATVSVRQARRIAHRRAERLRLIADCDAQHNALMKGDGSVGVYGRYPVVAEITA